MFCSNCGKTLKPDAVTCPHCGELVGESRFDGHPYTGAQKRIRPGEAVRLPGNHTKTTYMGSEPSMEDTGVDARTTYRATAGGSAPGYGSGEAEPLFNSIDEETACAIIVQLRDAKLVTENEAALMRAAIGRNALALPVSGKDVLRAAVLGNMLAQVFRNAEGDGLE